MTRGRPWDSDDLTGGPFDEILAQVREVVPGLVVERLQGSYPADDDNVYFLGDERGLDRVQIDTCPGGRPPFLVEAEDRDGERFETSDVAEAAAAAVSWLGSGGAGEDLDPA
jgi:hypothetical protein